MMEDENLTEAQVARRTRSLRRLINGAFANGNDEMALDLMEMLGRLAMKYGKDPDEVKAQCLN